ncbi:hypothetical protein [Bacillus sp. CGMCC 1.16541]|uniref:hypothetical protein n=1 Tax=Bacillus sp. CGMCC 1.16541 TaxID=2185143 RepID=UPI000D73CC1C|nr:hypothetical protein [Bacillus sp. CGMCC 1.16541]
MKRLVVLAIAFMLVQPMMTHAQREVVDELAKKDIVLQAEERNGMYEDFHLQVNGHVYSFPDWQAVKTLSKQPVLKEVDLNGDGTKELVVLLPQKVAKGVFVNEAKVVTVTKPVSELLVYDARTILLKEVKYYMDDSAFHVQLNDKDVLKLKGNSEAPILSTDSFVSYDVNDNGLMATLYLEDVAGKKLGSFHVEYKKMNKQAVEPTELVFLQK